MLERLQSLDGEAQKAETVAQLGEPLAALEAMAGDLDMLVLADGFAAHRRR
ncbi:hypothetical protein AAHB60_25030 [Pseudomonas aeruginosa]